jgi:hypothetical protein
VQGHQRRRVTLLTRCKETFALHRSWFPGRLRVLWAIDRFLDAQLPNWMKIRNTTQRVETGSVISLIRLSNLRWADGHVSDGTRRRIMSRLSEPTARRPLPTVQSSSFWRFSLHQTVIAESHPWHMSGTRPECAPHSLVRMIRHHERLEECEIPVIWLFDAFGEWKAISNPSE